MFAILGEMAEDMQAFSENAVSDLTEVKPKEAYRREIRAADFKIAMRPFTDDGEFANLAGESEIDLEGEEVTYLDLQQGEADREIALML